MILHLRIGLYERILITFTVLALTFMLLMVFQPIDILLSKFLLDDTYYAYSITQNIIDGKGIVFNENIPTNGFHPLYNLAILIPIFKIFYGFGINIPIYISLVVIAFLTVSTSIILYSIVSKLYNKKAGLLAAFIWLFNPQVFFVSFIGLEVALQIFFLSLLTYYLLAKEKITNFSIKQAILIGLLLGFVFLSRLDGVFVGFGVVVAIILRKLSNKNFKINNLVNLARQPDLIAIIITASLVALPWLLWNFIELGRIIPISGEAVHLNAVAGHTLTEKPYLDLIKPPIYQTMGFVARFFLRSAHTTMQGIIIVFLALVIPAVLLLVKRDKFLPKLLNRLNFLIISTIAYFSFYWFYQFALRDWYSLYTSFLMTIIVSIMIIRLGQIVKPANIGSLLTFVLIGGMVVAFVNGGVVHYNRGNGPEEKLKWEAANFITDNIPSDVIIGAFNTGVYQYYTPNHDIINLDGVMNPEALEARKVHNIENYILSKNIAYIVDRAEYVYILNNSILYLEPIKTFEQHVFSYRNGEEVREISIFKVIQNTTNN